jgi:hypothetical protein
MRFTGLLNATCTIQEKQKAQGGTGQITVTWANKATNVKTRLNASRVPAVTESLGTVTVSEYTFYFEISVNIAQGDRVLFNSEAYEVTLVTKDSSNHHLEVAAKKISFE